MGGIFHSVGQVFEWSLLLHSFWLFFFFSSEDKTGGQHPLSKIKMSWECLSTNKCCLVISEVLGIKGLVSPWARVPGPIPADSRGTAQENHLRLCKWCGEGAPVLLKWIPVVFSEAEDEEIVLAQPWQQKADWWKVKGLVLPCQRKLQTLLLPTAVQYESWSIIHVGGDWGSAAYSVISYWNRQKCQLFAPANCWNKCNEAAKSCTGDKIFQEIKLNIWNKTWIASVGLLLWWLQYINKGGSSFCGRGGDLRERTSVPTTFSFCESEAEAEKSLPTVARSLG